MFDKIKYCVRATSALSVLLVEQNIFCSEQATDQELTSTSKWSQPDRMFKIGGQSKVTSRDNHRPQDSRHLTLETTETKAVLRETAVGQRRLEMLEKNIRVNGIAPNMLGYVSRAPKLQRHSRCSGALERCRPRPQLLWQSSKRDPMSELKHSATLPSRFSPVRLGAISENLLATARLQAPQPQHLRSSLSSGAPI